MLTKIDLEQIEEIVNRCVLHLKKDVAEMKKDIVVLKKDVANLKNDVSELKGDVTQLKTDVTQLKVDMLIVKTRTTTIDKSVKVIRHELISVNTFDINVANHVEAELDSFRWEINDKPKET